MSREIRSDVIAQLGELHYGRKRIQPASRVIKKFYEDASPRLQHEILNLSPEDQMRCAIAFDAVIRAQKYTVYALAIMDDHIHVCVRKHRDSAEVMIDSLQDRSRELILAAGNRDPNHPVWGGCGYKVFLDEPADVRRTIRYIEDNPMKGGHPPQFYSSVKPYDNWPFHKRK